MREEIIAAEMMLRNPLCVRWSDADYKLVVDTAWERRMRVSELVRQLVLEGLQTAGNSTADGTVGKAVMLAEGGAVCE